MTEMEPNKEKKETEFLLLQSLLEKKELNLQTRDYGYTLLKNAVENGKVDVVRLLSTQQTFKFVDERPSLLQIAVESGNLEIVSLLLLDPRLNTPRLNTVPYHTDILVTPCINNDMDLLQLLLSDSRFNPDDSQCFREACARGRTAIVKLLVKDKRLTLFGVDSSRIMSMQQWNNYNNHQRGINAVFEKGYYDLVQFFLEDSRFQLSSGLLSTACKSTSVNVVRCVLQDRRVQTPKDWSCILREVCTSNLFDILEILLQDSRVTVDPSLPEVAVCWSSEKVLQLLLKDSRICSSDRLYYEKAVTRAVIMRRVEHLKLLLLDKRFESSFFNQQLIRACVNGSLEIVQVLLNDPRIDPSVSNQQPLLSACVSGRLNLVLLLLKDKRVDPSLFPTQTLFSAFHYTDILKVVLEDKRMTSSSSLPQLQSLVVEVITNGPSESALLLLKKYPASDHLYEEFLRTACSKNSLVVAQFLLQKCRPSTLLLESACAKGNKEMVDLLLEKSLIDSSLNQKLLKLVIQHSEHSDEILPVLLKNKQIDPSVHNQFALQLAFKKENSFIPIVSCLFQDARVLPSFSLLEKYFNTTGPLHDQFLQLLLPFKFLCLDFTKHFTCLSLDQLQQVDHYRRAHHDKTEALLHCLCNIRDLVSLVEEYTPCVVLDDGQEK
jgi:ankyrin repeat protein